MNIYRRLDVHIWLVLVLSLPLLTLFLNNLSLVGMAEESVGYRYFYSLRILYDQGTIPFLPQGQIITALHCIIQRLLTLLGYTIVDLDGRVESFTYFSCILPIIVTFFAAAWAVYPVKDKYLKLFLILSLLVATFQTRVGGGFHLLIPDYYIWSLPLSLIAFGFFVREINQSGYLSTQKFWIAVYISFCFTMKITYLLMPMILILSLIINRRFKESALNILYISIVAISISSIIFSIYYRWDMNLVMAHFNIETYFLHTTQSSQKFLKWYYNSISKHSFDCSTFAFILPFFLLVVASKSSLRKASLILLVPSIISIYFVYKRSYPPTLVETCYLSLILAFACLYNISVKMAGCFDFIKPVYLKIFKLLLLLVFSFVAIKGLFTFFKIYFPEYKQVNVARNELNTYLSNYTGKTLYIITNNQYRPITIDTAIYKGGMSMQNNQWPQSALIASMVSNRSYIVESPNINIDPNKFEKIVFVASHGMYTDQANNISKLYNLDLTKYNCAFNVNQGIGGVNWFLPYVKTGVEPISDFYPADGDVAREIYVCIRDAN